jgi:hypothetical protein
MENFEKNMKHQVRFGRNKKTVFWIFSTLFIFISFTQNGFGQAGTTIQIIDSDSSLTNFSGGSVSVLVEPKLVFPLDQGFKLELSEDLKSDFDWSVVLEEKSFEIKSFDSKNISENQFVINSSELKKTSFYFFESSMFYFNIKLMHHVG